jgi:hypothetical protein
MGAHDFDRLNSVSNSVLAVIINQAAVAHHSAEGCAGRLRYLRRFLTFDLEEPVFQNERSDTGF